jgi:general secretion pathway protein D
MLGRQGSHRWKDSMRTKSKSVSVAIVAAVVLALLWLPSVSFGQLFPDPAATEVMTKMDLQGTMPLEALLKYLSPRLKVNYNYTAENGAKLITIKTPAEVPSRTLPMLLSGVLKSAGLGIVEDEVPGWKRIIQSTEFFRYAPFGDAKEVIQRDGPGAPVTQLFLLKKYSPSTVMGLIAPLQLQSPAGQQASSSSMVAGGPTTAGPNVIPLPDANAIVISDYASNIKRIAEFIEFLDKANETVFKFYQVKHQRSADLTEQIKKVFSTKPQSASVAAPAGSGDGAPPPPTTESSGPVRFFDDANGNRIVVVGRSDLVEEALKTLVQFDVSLDMKEGIFRPKNISAERLQKIVEGLLAPQDDERAYKGTVDEAGNNFVVRATPEIIAKIEKIIDMLDQAPTADENPIQIYKLKNATAEEVLVSLLALQEAYGASGGQIGGGQFFGNAFGLGIPGIQGQGISPFGTGANPFGSGFGTGFGAGIGNQGFQSMSLPLQNGQITTPGQGNFGNTGIGGVAGGTTGTAGTNARRGGQSQRGQQGGQQGQFGGGFGVGGAATLPGGVRVSADVGTNSLIIIGPTNVTPRYLKLIEALDRRRKQVMIEAKFIAINSTDSFLFGVEASGGDRNGPKRWFKFTSFGLSEVDAVTGALRIIPGRGANTTVVNPDVADAVIRALVTHQRAKVSSSPEIVVNDNQTAELESKVSIPFQSVNASNTVSTTSVGGNSEAGTSITVTPHINEDDHLQLEFEIEFSAFTGTGTATLPPARQIETVASEITIPDGEMIIVGGLKRSADNRDYAGVPWLEKIPLVRDLLGRTDESKNSTSFFVFIRPIILDDSKFGDLKFLSERRAGFMGIPESYPTSEPILMPAFSPAVMPASYQR